MCIVSFASACINLNSAVVLLRCGGYISVVWWKKFNDRIVVWDAKDKIMVLNLIRNYYYYILLLLLLL